MSSRTSSSRSASHNLFGKVRAGSAKFASPVVRTKGRSTWDRKAQGLPDWVSFGAFWNSSKRSNPTHPKHYPQLLNIVIVEAFLTSSRAHQRSLFSRVNISSLMQVCQLCIRGGEELIVRLTNCVHRLVTRGFNQLVHARHGGWTDVKNQLIPFQHFHLLLTYSPE